MTLVVPWHYCREIRLRLYPIFRETKPAGVLLNKQFDGKKFLEFL